METQTPRLLRDVLPPEFRNEFMDTRAATMLDVEVVEEVSRNVVIDGNFQANPNWRRWPGPAKNVHVWWVLADGRNVGWNESDSRGWSFPVFGKKAR